MSMTQELDTQKQNSIDAFLEFLKTLNSGKEEYFYLLNLRDGRAWIFGEAEELFNFGEKHPDGTYSARQWINMLHPKDRPFLAADMEALSKGEKQLHDMDYRVQRHGGGYVWVNCRGTVRKDEEGRPFFLTGRISAATLRYRIDSLTGLFNQEQFGDDIRKALEDRKGYVLMLGIDNMKTVNTVQGRLAGDRLIKLLAVVLEKESLEQKVYRLTGDTFVVPMFEGDIEKTQEFFYRVQNIVSRKMTISGGIVPLSLADMDYDSLLQYSEFALRKAKQSGKNTLTVFRIDDYRKEEEFVSLLDEMRNSVHAGCPGFSLVYQPQFCTSDYSLFGAEALLRYESPSKGRIFPDEFIPLLERFDLIYPIGLWVLREALTQCVKWRRYCPDFRISVNMSYMQLSKPDIVKDVLQVLEESGLPGEALTIEVTESMQLQKYEYFNDIFAVWKNRGITISVDDFGTGYSGLSYLKHLNIDEIKVDRCFVNGIHNSSYNYLLLCNVVQLAENAQLCVCCEGVEEMEELRVLKELKPTLLQGYLFSKPCDRESFERQFLLPDTTEHREHLKRMERIYEESVSSFLEIQHGEILRSLSMGLWSLQVSDEGKTRVLYLDENMRQLFGIDDRLTPGECYRYWTDRIYPEDRDHMYECVMGVLKTGKPGYDRYRWNHPQKGLIEIEGAGTRAEAEPGGCHLQGCCRVRQAGRAGSGEKKPKKLWEFFENFDDIVYVTDMDTNEMIYLNKKGLEIYGCSDLSEVVGKKCYQFLQNSGTPCAMCTNDRLREGEFLSWNYYNPLIKKNVDIKDTMTIDEGRRCRIEIATIKEEASAAYQEMDKLAQEAFRVALLAPTPRQALDVMLEYLGHALKADRIYIFEKNVRGNHDNTYEWVADGVTREIDNLQELPPETCEGWYQAFRKNETVIIKDLEATKETDPLMYEVLKPQNIQSLVTGPLYDGGEVIGFYGVDNPPKEYLADSSTVIKIMGQFTSMFLKVRNLVDELRHMSLSDQLTGIGNRYALKEQIKELDESKSLGVVFCDVTGLKAVNDTYGHQAGDDLIVRAARTLSENFQYGQCFRWGGDELVVLCKGCLNEQQLEQKVADLRESMKTNNVTMAVGAAWQEKGPYDVDGLLYEAEQRMYADKAEYYRKAGIDRRTHTWKNTMADRREGEQ